MENINVTAYVSGIAHPQRMEWLRKTIDHMDSQEFPFRRKILTIDQFDGHTVKTEELTHFISRGWRIFLDSHKSRVKSFDRAFSEIETEYIFYNEDDVMANLPDIKDLSEVFNNVITTKQCGMISMTLGGTKYDAATMFIGDLKFMEENVILESEDYIIFRRLEEFENDYFFEFPGLWARTDLFKDCHTRAKGINGQIEQALTTSYKNGGCKDKYYKCSIAKKGSLKILLDDPSKVNSHCRLLKNLDPDQGNSPVGGSHKY